MLSFEFVGWCKEDEHDKVWVAVVLRKGENRWSDMKYATFWGRRGKKLQHKIFTGTQWDLEKTVRSKVNKGYISIDQQKLDEVYPDFERDLQKTAVWAMLKA